jgi:hypothetical protein
VKLYHDAELKKGQVDDALPDAAKFVVGEALQEDIPIQLARLASGKHQERQVETLAVTTEDVVRLLAREMRLRGRLIEGGELFSVIQTAGLASATRKATSERQGKKSAHQNAVCMPSSVLNTTIILASGGLLHCNVQGIDIRGLGCRLPGIG